MTKLTTAVLILAAFSAPVIAAPSCTNWMPQPDGSEWRTCVDDQGRQYCERKYDGYITRIAC